MEDANALDKRRRAIEALSLVLQDLDLAQLTGAMKRSVTADSDSKETDSFTLRGVPRSAPSRPK